MIQLAYIICHLHGSHDLAFPLRAWPMTFWEEETDWFILFYHVSLAGAMIQRHYYVRYGDRSILGRAAKWLWMIQHENEWVDSIGNGLVKRVNDLLGHGSIRREIGHLPPPPSHAFNWPCDQEIHAISVTFASLNAVGTTSCAPTWLSISQWAVINHTSPSWWLSMSTHDSNREKDLTER